MKISRIKFSGILICTALLTALITYTAAQSTTPFTISSGIYPSGAASYTIWKEGLNYYAKNASGVIEYSGTNFATILSNCISSPNKLILIKAGEYELSSTITISQDGIYIRGENDMGHFARSAEGRPTGGTVIKATNNIVMFEWSKSSGHIYFGGLSHITLYGQNGTATTSVTAVKINRGSDLIFEYVFINLCGGDGFDITPSQGKIWNIWIRNCLIESVRYGVYIHDTIPYDVPPIDYDPYSFDTKIVDRINIQGCHTWDNVKDVYTYNSHEVHNVLISENQFYGAKGTSIEINNEVRRIQIIDNRIYDFGREADNLYDGIHLNSWTFDVIIRGNIIGDHWESGDRYELYIGSYVSKVLVEGNNFPSTTDGTPVYKDTTATNIVFRNNLGFVTQNSGTATITSSTSVTFEHGLSGTPTHVSVGFKTSGYGSWIWSATSTQITITVTNTGTYTFSWYAEYTP